MTANRASNEVEHQSAKDGTEQQHRGTCAAAQPFTRRHKDCGRPTMEGSLFCFWHHPDLSKYHPSELDKYFGRNITLAQALESDVAAGISMEGAVLQECNLGGTFLEKGPNLTGAIFANANLRGASLSEANFTNAVFVGSDLRHAKLSSCVLSGANFYRAKMFNVKFRDNDLQTVKHLRRSNFRSVSSFGLPTDRILEQYPEQSESSYRELARYFSSRALFEDASWAAYRASVQRHRLCRRNISWSHIKVNQTFGSIIPMISAVQSPVAVEYLMALSAWLKSGIFLLITGHGEKPFRVLIVAGLVIVAYACFFSIPGSTTGAGFVEALYFSVATFSTLGYGDIVPRGSFRLLAGSEALIGIVFTGLFLFCLSRKTVSRN